MTLYKGKHPAEPLTAATPMFHKYADSAVIDIDNAPPAKTLGHYDRMPAPRLMLGNGPDPSVAPDFEGAGDCVLAMKTNYHRLGYAIGGQGLFPATGATAIANYSEETGYVIDDESTDNGTSMRKSMAHWQKVGYLDALGKRHKILGWAVIDLKNPNHLLWAAYLSDAGVPTGVMFPNSAMGQFNKDDEWKPVKSDPRPDEGHCILLDYHSASTFRVESWARAQEASSPWIAEYADETYFVVTADGLVKGKSLEGFDVQQLISDSKAF